MVRFHAAPDGTRDRKPQGVGFSVTIYLVETSIYCIQRDSERDCNLTSFSKGSRAPIKGSVHRYLYNYVLDGGCGRFQGVPLCLGTIA